MAGRINPTPTKIYPSLMHNCRGSIPEPVRNGFIEPDSDPPEAEERVG